MILLGHDSISIEALAVILTAFASAIVIIIRTVWKRRNNGKTKVIEADAATQCLRILKDVTFYRINDEGQKTYYVRGSAQKPLEDLAVQLEAAFKKHNK